MKAIVDQEACIGCRLCAEVCPEVFEMADDIAKVIVPEIPADALERAKDSSDSCPVDAISIEE